MSEPQPKTDYLANSWWHLIAEIDKVPASHTDWLCDRLATITRFAQTQAAEFPIRERIKELVIEIHKAHKFNSWPNVERMEGCKPFHGAACSAFVPEPFHFSQSPSSRSLSSRRRK